MKAFLVFLLCCSGTLSTLYGQWQKEYERGCQAIQERDWKEAITRLQKALTQKSGEFGKVTGEDGASVDYIPHYYLGLAYFSFGDWDNSESSLREALSRGYLTPQQAEQARVRVQSIELRRGEVATAELLRQVHQYLDAKRYRDAFDLLNLEKRTSPKHFGRNPELPRLLQYSSEIVGKFQLAVAQAEGLLRSGDIESARRLFNEAEAVWPKQPAVAQGLSDISRFEELIQEALTAERANRRDVAGERYEGARKLNPAAFRNQGFEEALTRLRLPATPEGPTERLRIAKNDANSLYEAALRLFAQSSFKAAADKAGEALAAQPDDPRARSLRDRALARWHLQEGKNRESTGKYPDAESEYRQALALEQKNADASSALSRLVRYNQFAAESRAQLRSGKKQEARELALRAERIDPKRFSRDRELLTTAGRQVVAPVRHSAALRQALRDLFSNRTAQAIKTLEKEAERGVDDPTLLAYLGVAYASSALVTSDEAETRRFQARAQVRFAQALKAKPDLQLPENVISPRVLELFREVAAGTK